MHDLRVRYTTDDDGIWVVCSTDRWARKNKDCNWQKNLGIWPNVQAIEAAVQEHNLHVLQNRIRDHGQAQS